MYELYVIVYYYPQRCNRTSSSYARRVLKIHFRFAERAFINESVTSGMLLAIISESDSLNVIVLYLLTVYTLSLDKTDGASISAFLHKYTREDVRQFKKINEPSRQKK